jgi:CHAD domain-containing protein
MAATTTRVTGKDAILLLPPAAIMRNVEAVVDDLDTRLGHSAHSAEDIHHIRVDIKKLRAWIRLLRLARGRRLARKTDRKLRALARVLTQVRDQQVLPDTLARLRKACTSAAQARLLAALAARLMALPHDENFPAATELPRGRLRRLGTPLDDRKALCNALKESYTRAQRLGKSATRPGAPGEELHRWRRRVKYLGYQLALTTAEPGKSRTPLQRNLAALGSTLGTLQDLNVLGRHLELLQDDPACTEALVLATRLLAREYRKQLATATRLYRSGLAGPGMSLRLRQ